MRNGPVRQVRHLVHTALYARGLLPILAAYHQAGRQTDFLAKLTNPHAA